MAAINITSGEIAAGLLEPGFGLGSNQFTFSIPTTGSVWPRYNGGQDDNEPFSASYSVLNPNQAAAFRAALASWDDLIAPDFTEVADNATSRGELRIAFTDVGADIAGYAYAGNPQDPGGLVGDIWLSNDYATLGLVRGTYEYEVLVHEIGHTLGLKHSFEAPALSTAFDSTRYTVMSYTNAADSELVVFERVGGSLRASFAYAVAVTPMVLDIAAAQQRYGADTQTRAGDSSYTFTQGEAVFQSIYDAGGADTIDLSNFTRANIVDLTPGSYSSIGQYSLDAQIADWTALFPTSANFIRDVLTNADLFTFADNVGIAFGTVIENARGGSAADRLSGNDVANILEGGGGNDVLDGRNGADRLVGGGGNDTLTGGAGGDVFVFTASGSGADRVTDFVASEDRFDLQGGSFTAVSASGSGSLLSYAGGTVQVDGVTGLSLTQWNALVLGAAPVNTAPVITSPTSASAAENVATTTVVYTATATDAEGQALFYALGGPDAALFAINSASGAVTFRASPDFDASPTRTSFSFTVTAADTSGAPSAAQAVTLSLTNVNEAPVFASATRSVSVAENSATSAALFAGGASDPDAGTVLGYSLTGADAGAFAVDAASGAVTFRTSPDFEARSSYNVTLVATDAGGLSASQTVNVAVTNVNEAPVFASGTRSVTVAENNAIAAPLFTGGATDPDAGAVLTYSLTGADAAAFAVDAASGAVTFRASPDFEVRSAFGFNLIATDAAGLTASQTVSVAVTDVSEAIAPGSLLPNFFLLVPTGSAANVQGSGTVFGTIGGTQQVTVLDTPGRIGFDGSFNAGGDRIVLTGAASGYSVRRNGATVEISDGDTTVAVPAGTVGADIMFADGVRSLSIDAGGGAVRLGGQVVTTTAAAITAAAGPALSTGTASTSVAAQLLVNGGGTAVAFGNTQVFGTITGQEVVTVTSGARLAFDGSFNAGGDRVVFASAAASWSVSRSGATVFLAGPGGESVAVPVGQTGLTLAFADGNQTLIFDAAAGQVRIGGVTVGPNVISLTPGGTSSTTVPQFAFVEDARATAEIVAPFDADHAGLAPDTGLIPLVG